MKFRPASTYLLFVLCLALLAVSGCDQAFDSRGALDKRMVVFSVLSTDREIQFVRVQSSFMPSGYDPTSYASDHSLDDVSVRITEFGRYYDLRDTLVWTSDTSHYKFPIHMYYLNSFTPLRGRAYRVVIHSPSYGDLTAGTTVPDKAKITVTPELTQILDRPEKAAGGALMTFTVQMSKFARGCLARFYVYYDVLKEGEWFEEAIEVPLTSADAGSLTIAIPRYPRMNPVPTSLQQGIIYRNAYYRWAINQINDRYKSTQVIFKWIAFVVLQTDDNLYTYYVSTHGEMDPYSVRLDEPLASRAGTGLGVVGSYGLDSLVYLLPYDFWGNR